MLHPRFYFLLISLLLVLSGFSVEYESSHRINWTGITKLEESGIVIDQLEFVGSVHKNPGELPFFYYTIPIHTNEAKVESFLSNVVYVPAGEKEITLLKSLSFTQKDHEVRSRISVSQKQPFARIEFVPIRWNSELNIYEKIISFDLTVSIIDDFKEHNAFRSYTNNSVLSTGNWYKIRLSENGIYKITYNELQAMGFNVDVNPSKIAIFGNGGRVLPEVNDEFRYDDLHENPIMVVDGGDGSFDQGDYILFYGEGPVTWYYDENKDIFKHRINYYRDFTYYFITAVDHNAKRITELEPPSGNADIEISDFNDYAVHEIDERNIAGIGRTWFGELYDYETEYDFVFQFPNLIKNVENAHWRSYFAARAYSTSAFKIYIDGEMKRLINMSPLSIGNRYEYAKGDSTSFSFTPTSDQMLITTEYARSSNSSVGYLDFFEVNVKRNLIFSGDQMLFRRVTKNSSIAQYNLGNANSNITIWDITTPVNPEKVITELSGNILTFKADVSDLRHYIAFNGNSYLTVEFVEEVPNQNLHSYRNIDYLIIAYPEFLEQAARLAEFHRTHSNLSVLVVTIDQVYNEFSSGGQDITAIRDFAKMLYDDSSPGAELKYLLLFGDASYDYKDILPDNTNFVPCWESTRSLDIVTSIATDDYFGFLDDGEGAEYSDDLVDIGIGRFVVGTQEEAEAAVDKTIHYSVNTTQVMEPWRNIVTFLADDGDGNRHLKDAERLAEIFDTAFQVYNINKIYVDAYEQISSPSGQTAPAVNRAINDRIEKGTLILNYSGHGGEIGLGHERFLQISDIQTWKNYDMLSVFITATCEFTRYDDPTRVSAGELVFLNDQGGAISLFTTSRATFAGSNLALNIAIYKNNMFKRIDGEYPRFGDVIRRSKLYGTSNDKKFVLIGDPACRMAYPEHNAETIKINSQVLLPEEADTIKALQLVKVEGMVTDREGEKLNDFNGELFTSVYDKKTKVVTQGDENSPYTYYVRNSIIFNGKASITNGDFGFEFMVPKDISYVYGDGRISYYLRDTVTDGNGYYNNLIVGGFYEDAKEDTKGPEIVLFLNDTTFVAGSTTNQNPKLLAHVSDESGINTTGNGIGHDIVTTIDMNQELSYVLNDYYEADENHYNKGVINYPFSNLPEGEHTLSLKVWDVYNNSSIAYLDFVVVTADHIVIDNLMNYPNPFMNNTSFVFDHNQSGQEIEVQIEIFNSIGQLIKTFTTDMYSEGQRSEPIVWDGRKDNGGRIDRGFYVYRVTIRNSDGSYASDASKLIYVK